MGSTALEVEACVRAWGARLVDPSYDIEQFRQWILKEYPKHSVEVRRFWIGRYPVTNRDYFEYVDAVRCPAPESIERGSPGDHPVWGVSFDDACAYAAWLSEQLRKPFRLPTEAEWEYTARGPSGREYPFGHEFDAERCNTAESGIGATTPVDRYPHGASEHGAFDLAGNVEEWTSDVYAPYPGGRFIEDDLSRSLGAHYRVLRGGSFARGGDLARCARRHGPFPSPEFRYTGFRIVTDA